MARPWVIKFGGSLMSDDGARRAFLKEAASISRRQPLVLVHGGGPEINAALERQNIKPQFLNGRRVTDEATMAVVEQVLSGQVNKKLVGELSGLGARAAGLSGRDGGLLRAAPLKDLGRVGKPAAVQPKILDVLLKGGFLPVISSVAAGPDRAALNVNADDAAAAVALAMKAAKLIFLTDVAGVLDGAKKTIPLIRTRDVKKLIADGTDNEKIVTKLESCLSAIQKGVGEVDIIDGRAGLKKMKGTRILP